MKQTKMCLSSLLAILLAVVLAGCGNKGPLVAPGKASKKAEVVDLTTTADSSELVETQEKELKK